MAAPTKMRVASDFGKAVAHPIRHRCLAILVERVASPREVADALGEDLRAVSYHIRKLRELGKIELVKTRSGGGRRGATEHWYRAVTKPVYDTEAWSALTPEERGDMSGHGIELLLGDAARSIAEGTFDERLDRLLTRQIPVVDEQGWAAIVEIMESAFHQVNDVEAASAARIAESGEQGFPATVGMLVFERPKRLIFGGRLTNHSRL